MIEYRFRFIKETYVPLPVLSEYTLHGMPRPSRWPANWEWTFDFPDLCRAVRDDLRYHLSEICLALLRKLGVDVARTRQEFAPATEVVNVDTRDLIEAIRRKLSEYQMRQVMEGAMILVGPREFHEIRMLDDVHYPLLMNVSMKVGYKGRYDAEPTYTLLGVPIVMLPDFVGVAVVPDFAKLGKREPVPRW